MKNKRRDTAEKARTVLLRLVEAKYVDNMHSVLVQAANGEKNMTHLHYAAVHPDTMVAPQKLTDDGLDIMAPVVTEAFELTLLPEYGLTGDRLSVEVSSDPEVDTRNSLNCRLRFIDSMVTALYEVRGIWKDIRDGVRTDTTKSGKKSYQAVHKWTGLRKLVDVGLVCVPKPAEIQTDYVKSALQYLIMAKDALKQVPVSPMALQPWPVGDVSLKTVQEHLEKDQAIVGQLDTMVIRPTADLEATMNLMIEIEDLLSLLISIDIRQVLPQQLREKWGKVSQLVALEDIEVAMELGVSLLKALRCTKTCMQPTFKNLLKAGTPT